MQMRKSLLSWPARLLLLLAILVASTLALMPDRQPPVQALSDYLSAFRTAYPWVAGSSLDSCNTCHTIVPDRNPYGLDYESHAHNFAAIEPLDSDGDGFTNLQEIQALTFPGNPASHPAPTATFTPTRTPTTAATFTPTPTRTPTAAATRTPTPTNTPGAGPTDTPTPTPAVGPTNTPSPTPSSPTTTPTSTALPAPTATPTPYYQLIGWNDLGMHYMNESYANLAVLPPYNNLWAQLIRVGTWPQVITANVVVEYKFQNNTSSVSKTNFWTYAKKLFGVDLAPDTGLTGAGMQGAMKPADGHFVVEGVPLTPYEDGKPHTPQPYQLADLIARDAATGQVLATTTFVAPVSTEMHCGDCHADGRQEDIATGNVETNILTLHDKEEHTNLMGQRPVLCAKCHGSNALGMAGQPGLPNLSRAIHGKHAEDDEDRSPAQLALDPADDDKPAACYQCHPGLETKYLRGVMAAGMRCESCHGSLNAVASPARRPWIDLPRCATCHGAEHGENPGKLFRQSIGHGGLYCEACHGSTHAELPSTEPRDNIQVMRLQEKAGTLSDCRVCHGLFVPDAPGPHGLKNPYPTPTPTRTPTPTSTPAPTLTPTFTPTFTPSPTPTLAPTFTPTTSPEPTFTVTPSPSPSPTASPSPTETPTHTPSPTATPPLAHIFLPGIWR